ncbi:MAG: hypothetical protein PHG02_00325 [Oscillospiraceae bacterium]|nr:hypothetical protein [Oscillospiraceae bacterium]
MKYALNLGTDGRVLSVTYAKYAADSMALAQTLPEGDVGDYRYQNGSYVYDPLPQNNPAIQPSQWDTVEAQAVYTAMMTDTLLEG